MSDLTPSHFGAIMDAFAFRAFRDLVPTALWIHQIHLPVSEQFPEHRKPYGDVEARLQQRVGPKSQWHVRNAERGKFAVMEICLVSSDRL
jgi:hypothetical protein